MGIGQQSDKKRYDSAMLSDWEQFSNGLGQCIQQHGFTLGIAQQGDKTRLKPAMFQDCKQLSIAKGRGIR